MARPGADVPFPVSNAGPIVEKLVSLSTDFSGAGLVELSRLLLARAEQIRTLKMAATEFGRAVITGVATPDQLEANACLQPAFFETACIKHFLASLYRKLAEQLDWEVHEQQQHLRPIRKIVYAPDGDIESFELA